MPEYVKKVILKENLIENGDLVIVAVSGGADSLSLLHILERLKREKFLDFSLHAAHLNHGMRGDSAKQDAEFVRREARKMGIPCTIGEVDVEAFRKSKKLSPEDAARRLRYRFLEQLAKRIGASSIAAAHSLDDQAETLLINFLRGTGLDGLSGMKVKRRLGDGELYLVRPLLKINKKEINAYCRENGLSPRFDETNLNSRFLRNKIRLELLPYLEREFNPDLRRGLFRLSSLLSHDKDFLENAASESLSRIITKEDTNCLELEGEKLLGEHEALQGRILRLAICRVTGSVPREVGYNHIRAVLQLYRTGTPHGLLDLPGGLEVSKRYNKLVILLKELQQRGELTSFNLPVPGRENIPGRGQILQAELISPEQLSWPPDEHKEAYLDYEKVLDLLRDKNHLQFNADSSKLLVRARREGDRFHPLGAPGKKKINKYFIDHKIPMKERDSIPLVAAGDEIIWVVGKQISHNCRVTEETKKVLVLKTI
ncbi:MAG: tRNA lysidine(34) synthetase TilS [Bacillota bacterium]|nr:tRNA lysidine(34) synthetase TilS [Bacillota bacterium]